MSANQTNETISTIDADLGVLELGTGWNRQQINGFLDEEKLTISSLGEIASFVSVVIDLNGEVERTDERRTNFFNCLRLVTKGSISHREFSVDELVDGFAEGSPSREYVKLGEMSQAFHNFIVRNDTQKAEEEARSLNPFAYPILPRVHLSCVRQRPFVQGDVDFYGERVYKNIADHLPGCAGCSEVMDQHRKVLQGYADAA